MNRSPLSKVGGVPDRKFGHYLAGIYVSCHAEARVLQDILQEALRNRAAQREEPLLAQWNNDLASIRRRAIAEGWTGWEDHA